MQRVLILGDNPYRITDQIHLAQQLLSTNSDYEFTFLLVHKNLIPFFSNTHKNISYKFIGTKIDNKNVQINRVISTVEKKVPPFLFELFTFLLVLFDLYKNYFRIKKIINQINPKLIITNKDSNIGIEPIVLKIAKQKKIKVVIPYLVYTDNIGISELIKRKKNKRSRLWKKLALKLLPGQINNYKGDSYLFYPPAFTFAYYLFGTLSKNPWHVGMGLSDILCVDTQHTFNRYRSYKVPSQKLKIVGDVTFDTLFITLQNRNKIKEQIVRKYKLSDKRIIMLSLPQLAELNLIDNSVHLKEIHFLLKELQKLNCNILVSLHPRMNRLDYQFIEQKFKCKILDERLFKVIAIADLFVSTYSSTVIWAVLSHVQSIIVDFNNLDYKMYNFLRTVSNVKTKSSFFPKVKSYLNKKNVDFTHDWEKLSRQNAFDGKTIERYNNLFTELM